MKERRKVIIIDSCKNCPFLKRVEVYDYNPEITCTRHKEDGWNDYPDIENEDVIPDWCPLTDMYIDEDEEIG